MRRPLRVPGRDGFAVHRQRAKGTRKTRAPQERGSLAIYDGRFRSAVMADLQFVCSNRDMIELRPLRGCGQPGQGLNRAIDVHAIDERLFRSRGFEVKTHQPGGDGANNRVRYLGIFTAIFAISG